MQGWQRQYNQQQETLAPIHLYCIFYNKRTKKRNNKHTIIHKQGAIHGQPIYHTVLQQLTNNKSNSSSRWSLLRRQRLPSNNSRHHNKDWTHKGDFTREKGNEVKRPYPAMQNEHHQARNICKLSDQVWSDESLTGDMQVAKEEKIGEAVASLPLWQNPSFVEASLHLQGKHNNEDSSEHKSWCSNHRLQQRQNLPRRSCPVRRREVVAHSNDKNTKSETGDTAKRGFVAANEAGRDNNDVTHDDSVEDGELSYDDATHINSKWISQDDAPCNVGGKAKFVFANLKVCI